MGRTLICVTETGTGLLLSNEGTGPDFSSNGFLDGTQVDPGELRV